MVNRHRAADDGGRDAASRRSSSAPAVNAAARAGFRPELHGLRGLAILLVVLYHVWFDRVSGGVDVFLFLSAFFLTGTFIRRIESGRPLRPAAYWARAFKRLLAPAAAVILATLAGVRLLLPESTWMPSIQDGLASLLQVENWLLISREIDYEAAVDLTTPPLQHFWSLSIQGQVFLLWPLLFAACALVARSTRLPARTVVAVALVLVAAASFAWSLHSTGTQQPVAYFDTRARLWEFAAGSLLALVPARVAAGAVASSRLPARLRVVLGWAGIAILVGTGALIDGRSLFPGWIAAIPLAGAALVFVAGATGSRLGADRLLASRPFSQLGDISYALYLVHWPLLILTLSALDRSEAGLSLGAAIIAVSVVLAWLLTRFVDTPVRRWAWAGAKAWRSGAVVAIVLVLAAAPLAAAQHHLHRVEEEALLRADTDNPGGRVLVDGYAGDPDGNPDSPPIPSMANLRQDWAAIGEPCAGEVEPSDPQLAETCTMTDAPEGSKVLVVVGNSRMAQTAEAFTRPATEHGWRLVLVRMNSCAFTPGVPTYLGEECDAHNDAALEYLLDLQPDAVAVTTTLLPKEGQAERASPVLDETVPQLQEAGLEVVPVRDEPRLSGDVVACLEDGGSEAECTYALEPEIMPDERPDASRLAELSARRPLHPVDLTASLCPGRSCPPTIGNVHVFFDPDHVTATYLRTLGDETDRQLTGSGFPW